MVLRDLPQGRIGSGNNGDHLGQRGVRHLRPAKLCGHGNAPQAAIGKHVDHLGGHLTQPVTLSVTLQQKCRHFMGNINGFGIRADHMGIGNGKWIRSIGWVVRHGFLTLYTCWVVGRDNR